MFTGLKSLCSLLGGAQIPASRWDILNISPTGMAIRRHPSAEKNISVGALVGIKTNADTHISIGIVRRANCGNRDRLDIGVQLIAPQATAAIAQIDARDYEEPVLMLPEISAVSQAATIIAPRGTYAPARVLTIQTEGKIQKVMLTKLVECTPLIERVQYSNII